MAAKTKAELEAEIDKLKAENNDLKSQEAAAESATTGPSKTSRRWRAFAATVLVSIGVIITPVAVIGSWTKTQLESTEAFVQTFGPLAKDPSVQQYIGDQINTAVNKAVDIDKVTGQVFDGLESLGLPPIANQALGMLEGPAASGVKSLISDSITKIVTSPAFETALVQALTISHEQIISVLQGKNDNTALVLGDDGSIGIATGPIIDQVKKTLVDQGIGIANAIPAINTTIVLAQNDQLALLRPAYQLSIALGNGLPWVALGFVLAGILVAANRKRALFGSALSLGIMLGALAGGFGVVKLIFIASVSPSIMPVNVADTLFTQLTERMSGSALALAVLMFAIALVTWFAGLKSAAKYRGATADAATFVRDAAEKRGITTGKVGDWLFTYRLWIRAGIGLIAALVLLLTLPVTIAGIIWTLVLSLLAVFVLELTMRPTAS